MQEKKVDMTHTLMVSFSPSAFPAASPSVSTPAELCPYLPSEGNSLVPD